MDILNIFKKEKVDLFIKYIGEGNIEKLIDSSNNLLRSYYQKYQFVNKRKEFQIEAERNILPILEEIKAFENKGIYVRFYTSMGRIFVTDFVSTDLHAVVFNFGNTNFTIEDIYKDIKPSVFLPVDKEKYLKTVLDIVKTKNRCGDYGELKEDYVNYIYSHLPENKKIEYRKFLRNVYNVRREDSKNKLNKEEKELFDKLNLNDKTKTNENERSL